MTRVSRRDVLAGIAGGVSGSIAGCSARGDVARLDQTPSTLFRGDLQRRGYYPDATVPATVDMAWRIADVNPGEHTAAKASPVVAPSGDLIVPGDDGRVSAVTPSGDVRWSSTTEPSARGIHGTPVIANDTVYVGAYDGALYAFDLTTGDREWRTKLGDAIGSSPAYHDGILYIPVEFYAPSGSLYAVSAATGAVIAEDDRPTNHPHSTSAIAVDAGKLVFGANDGMLYAWDYPSLDFAWAFETGGAIKGPVAVDGTAAVFGSWDHTVYRVDLAAGTAEWTFRADGKVMSGPGIDPARGIVYIGSHDTHLYALDFATGERLWAFDTGGIILGCPTVTADSILVGSYDRHLYACTHSGEERWRAATTGWVTSTPLVYGDGIYFTDRATDDQPGGLYRLAPASAGA